MESNANPDIYPHVWNNFMHSPYLPTSLPNHATGADAGIPVPPPFIPPFILPPTPPFSPPTQLLPPPSITVFPTDTVTPLPPLFSPQSSFVALPDLDGPPGENTFFVGIEPFSPLNSPSPPLSPGSPMESEPLASQTALQTPELSTHSPTSSTESMVEVIQPVAPTAQDLAFDDYTNGGRISNILALSMFG